MTEQLIEELKKLGIIGVIFKQIPKTPIEIPQNLHVYFVNK